MVGIVILAHGSLAHGLLDTVNFITGGEGHISAVAIDHNMDVSEARRMVKDAVRAADEGYGVLVATDLYGGTPSNLAMSFKGDLRMEIIAGVNLPILIKAVSLQRSSDLETMAKKLHEYGKENIYLASDLLISKKAAGETG